MIPDDESYDNAHFEFVMRGIQAARETLPELADDISLSLHCETAEIMRAYTTMVQQEGRLHGLEAYSAARPPHSEGLAVVDRVLPRARDRPAQDQPAAPVVGDRARGGDADGGDLPAHRLPPRGHDRPPARRLPHARSGLGGKVNPPLRSRADVEALWEHLLAGDVDWVVSDHACCRDEMKFGDPRDDVFLAKSGFGGTEYLLPGLITEGRKRGLSYQRIAELVSANPASRFGLHTKGRIADGL